MVIVVGGFLQNCDMDYCGCEEIVEVGCIFMELVRNFVDQSWFDYELCFSIG